MKAFASACYVHGHWCGADRWTEPWVIAVVVFVIAGGIVTDLARRSKSRR